MEQRPQNELIETIFSLFDTGEEAISFLSEQGLEENSYLLKDLETLCETLAASMKELYPQISLKNKLEEIGLNAPYSVAEVRRGLEKGAIERAYMQFHCTFVPLFLFWRRYAAFFFLHAADDASLSAWYEEERRRIRRIREAQPLPEEDREYRYDFSVVVLFYGNKKMTGDCLNAIRKYTKGHSYELITFDNGSDPETAAWCEALPHEKKIYYPHNMGSSAAVNLILTMAPYYIEGKYLLYVSNDVIVTPRYDEILYECIESDPRIAIAVPVCNSASNLQAIAVPYASNDMAGMQAFAEGYNHSDPRKRVDRSRLFDILAAYRPQALRQMELALDPLFCYDMFADDDHSCTLRRMGYRQVLCRDVFVHHYGSATLGAGQFQVMDLGREQFYKKHGVDAWNSLGADLYASLGTFSISGSGSFRVLALNPLFGDSVLALCARLREGGFENITVDALTEDPRYLEDMEALFHKSGLLSEEENLLEGLYDIAIVGSGLERCRDLRTVAHTAAKWLRPGGLLLTQYRNLFNMDTLLRILQGSAPVHEVFLRDSQEEPMMRLADTASLRALMEQEGMTVNQIVRVANENWKVPTEKILKMLGIRDEHRNAAEALLVTSDQLALWVKRSV